MGYFIGYHATGSKNRSSLQKGLKAVESAWDPGSGGELGPGFYLTRDYKTACLYGFGIAQAAGDSKVDVWRVESPNSLFAMKHLPVPAAEQWKNIKKSYCDEPYYWLSNAQEGKEPVQVKFNNWALGLLSLSLFKMFTLAEAQAESEHGLVS